GRPTPYSSNKTTRLCKTNFLARLGFPGAADFLHFRGRGRASQGNADVAAVLQVFGRLGNLVHMGGVAGYLAGRAAFAPVVNQAAGRDAEVAPQCRMITQPQLLAEQGGFQLTVELAVQ